MGKGEWGNGGMGEWGYDGNGKREEEVKGIQWWTPAERGFVKSASSAALTAGGAF